VITVTVESPLPPPVGRVDSETESVSDDARAGAGDFGGAGVGDGDGADAGEAEADEMGQPASIAMQSIRFPRALIAGKYTPSGVVLDASVERLGNDEQR
jgi:hypothetical protein